MRVLSDTICKVCQGVFCCADCRQKHEIKNHAIIIHKPLMMSRENQNSEDTDSINDAKPVFETTYLLCPICEKLPLILQPELHEEMLLHIELYHLPLRCRKCFKIYKKINDFKEFSKCLHPTIVYQCQESSASTQSCCIEESPKETVIKSAMPCSVMSQYSPLSRQDFNERYLTPMSVINMRWKAKSKLAHEEFISDSVSSIKNISSISNSSIRRSTELKGKVIRCSSTPVHLEMVFTKPKEQTFNATGGGHMSSIQYNSGCESDNSPAFSLPNSQSLEPANRYMKVTGRPRISAITPLRQVMSKSIRKAFAEHGLPATTTVRGCDLFQRKNMFNGTSSPEISDKNHPQEPPLDLRLSPAVRRSQSEEIPYSQQKEYEYNELPNIRREFLLSAQKLTTESIVITRTEHLSSVSSSTSISSSNYSMNSVQPYSITTNSYQSAKSNNTVGSVLESCSSVEIITATTEDIQHLQSLDQKSVKHNVLPPLTPISRIPGSVIHKKIIKFETPKIESCDSLNIQNSPNDVFFTPNATPIDNCGESLMLGTKKGQLLAKQNLIERFSPLRRPPIKECAHSASFNHIGNIADDIDRIHNIENKEAILPQENENSPQKLNAIKKENETLQPRSLWSLMSSVMRLPSRKISNSKESNKNEKHSLVGSGSIIKRCASIAGSLGRTKSLVDENELISLKRKRTYTTDNQSSLAYLAEFNNSGATSPTSRFNTSSKRFRIQGRRPIDRMRLNS